ncbi:hypothetical protein [Clostridium hydrogenum]|uniref:hypothetical protein n=1 Tax=Clostridium hydrogenum TaxID=2855764 RepID=UPI001F1AC001|nr:hypothetical protein [Clostridium hydrogenum]
MKKRIANLIFETNSIKAFIVLALILFSLESKIKFNMLGTYIYKAIIYIFIFLFIVRMIKRGINLYKLTYFNNGYDNDSLKRADQLGDLSIIITLIISLLQLKFFSQYMQKSKLKE